MVSNRIGVVCAWRNRKSDLEGDHCGDENRYRLDEPTDAGNDAVRISGDDCRTDRGDSVRSREMAGDKRNGL